MITSQPSSTAAAETSRRREPLRTTKSASSAGSTSERARLIASRASRFISRFQDVVCMLQQRMGFSTCASARIVRRAPDSRAAAAPSASAAQAPSEPSNDTSTCETGTQPDYGTQRGPTRKETRGIRCAAPVALRLKRYLLAPLAVGVLPRRSTAWCRPSTPYTASDRCRKRGMAALRPGGQD